VEAKVVAARQDLAEMYIPAVAVAEDRIVQVVLVVLVW
jgi:hypothetical protein